MLCARCFREDDHIGHQISFSISKGSGGSCDCGEDESWKTDLNCPVHSKNIQSGLREEENLIQNDIDIEEKLKAIIQSSAAALCTDLMSKSEENNPKYKADQLNCTLVLFNDENHSYQEVIDILVRTRKFSPKNAHDIASTVDKHVNFFSDPI